MRMIVLAYAYPIGDFRVSQCLLCRDGKYSIVIYHINGRVSKYNISTSKDYDGLLRYNNEWLLRNL